MTGQAPNAVRAGPPLVSSARTKNRCSCRHPFPDVGLTYIPQCKAKGENAGKKYTFNQIEKKEYKPLVEFLNSKESIEIRNLQEVQSGLAAATQLMEEDDESDEEDEDFGSDDGGGSDSSSDSDSDSEGSASDDMMEEAAKKISKGKKRKKV